ncbi:MAG: nitrogen fixation protein NifQ [Acidiferrobacter sp.]
MATVGHGHEASCAATGAIDSALVRAFAGVTARFRTLGLAPQEFAALRRQYLGERFHLDETVVETGACVALRADEHGELVELLLVSRADDSKETFWLANTIATACLGDNHLWQDMGLAGRDELSWLLQRHFTSLYEKNVDNMKWKKFFYKELCRRERVVLCKAPSCGVCADYAACFGAE